MHPKHTRQLKKFYGEGSTLPQLGSGYIHTPTYGASVRFFSVPYVATVSIDATKNFKKFKSYTLESRSQHSTYTVEVLYATNINDNILASFF